MKKNKVVITLIILANIIIVIGIVLIANYSPTEKEVKKKVSQQIDENADDFFEKKEDTPNITLPGWGTIYISADTTNITEGIDFYNPEANKNYYYLTFELKIGNESLYKSGLVPPGKHIQKITLSRPLKAGEYEASVFMQPYKYDKTTPTNNGVVKVKLIVK